jgi:hypothetical protein
MGRILRRGIFFFLLMGMALPAAAMDPILMFVFTVAREMMDQHNARKPAGPTLPHIGGTLPEFPKVYPGTMVEPEHLRMLIDECFPYLSEDRRREIFDSLHAGLLDPRNAPVRAALIDYFAERAFAVRAAQQRLQKMSGRAKALLAEEFKKEVATLPPEERARVRGLLREGLLPVPSDFSQMLLGAVESSGTEPELQASPANR